MNSHLKMRSKSLIMIGIVMVAILLSSATADSGTNWWEKGTEIVKDLGKSESQDELTVGEIGGAFKDALRVGTENVVNQLGGTDGFNADSAVHIPLPEELNSVKSMLKNIGMSGLLDDLELRLNRAAESATSTVKGLFWQAISDMTFSDVKTIYEGPDDAATQYFKNKMSPDLAKEMEPIVDKSLSEVGAIQSYDQVMGKYKSIPFVPDVKADLNNHVVEKGMDGIFYYMAKEEAAIRQNPAKRTTELMKRVFGAN